MRHGFLTRTYSTRLSVYLLLLGCLSAISPLRLHAADRPLPDLNTFLQVAKNKMLAERVDAELLNTYTYRKKVLEETLKKDNTVKSSEWKEYEVFPSKEGNYTRLLSKNGVPLPPKELKKQDEDQADKERKRLEREARLSPRERQAKIDLQRKERKERIEEVFNAFYFTLLGREWIEGSPALVLAFTPKPNAPLSTRAGKMIFRNVAGKVWVEENEYALMKIIFETIDSITFGAGLLAKLDKGTVITQELRKVNNEVWLPVRVEMRLKARLLMAKGINQRRLEEYWDYKKYSVSAAIKF